MSESISWRGVRFARSGLGGKHECWVSELEVWKVERFSLGQTWYARLKLGTTRIQGEGETPKKALEQARRRAIALRAALGAALESASGV